MKKIIKEMIFASFALAFVSAILITTNVFAAEPTAAEKKIIKDAKKRIEAPNEEDDPNWVLEDIVGWQFTPDKGLLKKLQNVEDNTYDENFSFYYDKKKTKLSEKEFYASLYNIATRSYDGDKTFELYGVHDDSAMYVKTTDDQYVEILVPPVSNYEILPDVSMGDYDDDGEYELTIIPHVLHGTGYYEDSFIIIDQSENGTWFAYHLNKNIYLDYFDNAVETSYKNKKLSIKLHRKEIGKPITVEEESDYYLNSLTEISMTGDTVLVSTVPLAYPKSLGYAIGELSDYKIWLSIEYEGCGVFDTYDSMYQLYAKKLYEKQIEELPAGKFYGFVEGPCVDSPLMLVSDSVIEQVTSFDEDSVFSGHAPCFCDVYAMVNNKYKKIGTLEGGTNVYAVSYNENAIIVRDHHSVRTYVVENNKLVLDTGIQDDVACVFDEKYEGYGIYDGKKFKKISKKLYDEYRMEFAKGHEIYFQR